MDSTDVVTALGALAQDTRLAIFRLLVQQGPQGLPAGRVADRVGIPRNTLSFHLAQLDHARLVTARRDGRQVFYAASYDAMRGLVDFLYESCCQGSAGCEPVPVTSSVGRRSGGRAGSDRTGGGSGTARRGGSGAVRANRKGA